MAMLSPLSLLLVILTPLSYTPQYQRLLSRKSSSGISLYATFLNALVAQAQIPNMFYLFQSAHEMDYGVPIATPPLMRDWLNLAQIVVQWICSLLLFGLMLYLPVDSTNSSESAAATKRHENASKKITTTLLILHAALFAVAIFVAGRAHGNMDIFFNIVRGGIFFVAQPLLSLSVLFSFGLQALVTTDHGVKSLSKRGLSLQCAVFLALAIAWPFRLILPENLWTLPRLQPALLNQWYPWVGWACVNSAIIAIGSAAVLVVAIKSGEHGNTPERQVLLDAS